LTGLDLHPKWNACHIGNWPGELLALNAPVHTVPLSGEDALVLASQSEALWPVLDVSSRQPLSADFWGELEGCLDGQDYFPRLGMCSFKFADRVQPVYDIESAERLLLRSNPRVGSILLNDLEQKNETALYLFAWRDVPAWSEFRLFIRDRRVVGISQYHHQDIYQEIQSGLETIHAVMMPFCRELIASLHMETVIVDAFAERQFDGRYLMRLIELNPFIQRTDSCLFNWKNGGDFNGKLRYRHGNGQVFELDLQ